MSHTDKIISYARANRVSLNPKIMDKAFEADTNHSNNIVSIVKHCSNPWAILALFLGVCLIILANWIVNWKLKFFWFESNKEWVSVQAEWYEPIKDSPKED